MQTSVTRRRALVLAGSSIAIAGCVTGQGDDDADSADAGGSDDESEVGDDSGSADGTDTGGNGNDGTDGGPLAAAPDAVALDPVVDGLGAPVGMTVAPDAGLTYVVEQGGRIRGFDASGSLFGDPVLDLTESIVTGGERGLLGLALHPDFASNRRAFVRYSAPPRAGTPDGYDHTFVVASFEASADGTSFQADTESTIIEIPEPQSNHNAGDLAFGPDGYLYVPVGDGGAGNDQGNGHVDDWYGPVDGGNGQDVTENLLGSILRLDVDEGDPYAIPDDNPLVGEDGRDEHYAWGLRNPWRISFDEHDDGTDLYVADVGQSSYEEVNLVEAGGNYGWNVREGAHCFQADSCPTSTPEDVRGGEPLLDPVIEYPHSGGDVTGISVIGGHVYRGRAIDGLLGVYVFGDFARGEELFLSAPAEDDDLWPIATASIDGASLDSLFAFGRDADGELYALGLGENGGTVWRIGPVA